MSIKTPCKGQRHGGSCTLRGTKGFFRLVLCSEIQLGARVLVQLSFHTSQSGVPPSTAPPQHRSHPERCVLPQLLPFCCCTAPAPRPPSLTEGDAGAQHGRCPPLCSPLCRFVKWIEDGIPEDPFLNPELMKNNPWVEKGKCSIL